MKENDNFGASVVAPKMTRGIKNHLDGFISWVKVAQSGGPFTELQQ